MITSTDSKAPAWLPATPLQAITGFAAHLRDNGFVIGIAEQQAMVQAATRLPPGDRRPARIGDAWRAIACHGARDWRRWSELFDQYWHPQRVRGSTRISGQTRPARDLRQVVQQLQQDRASPPTAPQGMDTALQPGPEAAAGVAEQPPAPRAQGGASRTEALHDRSLHEWLPQDLSELQALAERIAQRLRKRLTRRWHDDAHGRRLDVRRTLRASLRTGGLPLQPAWRLPRRERPRLFILVDVSRSMETHAQLFLRIARALVQAADARVFVFHTRLAEVTGLLKRDSGAVQEKVNAVTAGFAGGTRIATSVADFQRVHARAQLGRGARVWLLSDGFDADPPDELAQQLQALRRRGAGLRWFHPSPQRPASQAMDAAAPLVQHFHRLSSLRDLAAAARLLN